MFLLFLLSHRIHSLEESLQTVHSKLEAAVKESQQDKSRVEQSTDLIKRLQKKLLFITKVLFCLLFVS